MEYDTKMSKMLNKYIIDYLVYVAIKNNMKNFNFAFEINFEYIKENDDEIKYKQYLSKALPSDKYSDEMTFGNYLVHKNILAKIETKMNVKYYYKILDNLLPRTIPPYFKDILTEYANWYVLDCDNWYEIRINIFKKIKTLKKKDIDEIIN